MISEIIIYDTHSQKQTFEVDLETNCDVLPRAANEAVHL